MADADDTQITEVLEEVASINVKEAPMVEEQRDELDMDKLREELAGLRKTPISRSSVDYVIGGACVGVGRVCVEMRCADGRAV